MKILVVEDGRTTRLRIESYLREWGHEPLGAADGAEALEIFQNQHVEMILSDWLMPNIDGIELIKRARALRADSGCLYSILLTVRSDTSDVVEGIESGADDFITKPFDKDELRARIRAGERILELESKLNRKNEFLQSANQRISQSNARMKQELEAAAKIQQSFLPDNLPKSPRANFAWHYEPCDELAGDTINIIPFDDKRFGMYVIDVSGHGVAAALLSVHLSRILTDLDSADAYLARRDGNGNGMIIESPARVAERLNHSFAFDLSRQQYFTLVYGILDLESRTFHYTSAGHPGPVIVDEYGNATRHKPTPPGIGIIPGANFTTQTLKLNRGDRLFLHTDGIFEIDNAKGEALGEDRLSEFIAGSFQAPLDESVNSVIDSVHRWRGSQHLEDDLSLMAVEIR
ncbi:MAG: SpoIIE family protein phosphatase [Verrucomicrobia bacterium]|nr:SpoIIE family protein phosphatase [Verrucomicrobiota bacterium]|tara:strand:- start:66790 stop:68001 length:1212 start_codon:yes stop_codon:yes gene_type:complete